MKNTLIKAFAAFIIGVVFIVGVYAFMVLSFQSVPQSAIFSFSDIRKPAASDRILVVAPHPDDETIAAGGFINNARKVGAQVEIVLVTNGNKHGLEQTRENEFTRVTSKLGIPQENLIFLDYPDGQLKNQDQTRIKNQFQKIIDSFNPNIIIDPNTNDTHLDHSTTSRIVDPLATEKKITQYQYLVHYRFWPQPERYAPELYLLPPKKLESLNWNKFVLTPEEETIKYQAIQEYKSQLKYLFPRELLLSSVRRNELFIVK